MTNNYYSLNVSGDRSRLLPLNNKFNSADSLNIINIIGNIINDKTALTPKERETLMGVYINALTSQISEKLNMHITPYFYHDIYHADSRTESEVNTWDIFLLKGKLKRYTQNYGEGILKSEIITDNNMIQSNCLTFYEIKIFSNTETLFSVTKSISDNFANAANLKCMGGIKEQHIENIIDYKNNSLLNHR